MSLSSIYCSYTEVVDAVVDAVVHAAVVDVTVVDVAVVETAVVDSLSRRLLLWYFNSYIDRLVEYFLPSIYTAIQLTFRYAGDE